MNSYCEYYPSLVYTLRANLSLQTLLNTHIVLYGLHTVPPPTANPPTPGHPLIFLIVCLGGRRRVSSSSICLFMVCMEVQVALPTRLECILYIIINYISLSYTISLLHHKVKGSLDMSDKR